MINVNSGHVPRGFVKPQFHFPDIASNDIKGVILETRKLEGTVMSSDSERTISVSGSGSVSTDSDKTPVRVDSQDSQVSDNDGDNRWPRQNSVRFSYKCNQRDFAHTFLKILKILVPKFNL